MSNQAFPNEATALAGLYRAMIRQVIQQNRSRPASYQTWTKRPGAQP